MVTRTQKIRLGFFVLISVLALVVTILAIVAPKFLEKRDVYFIGFRDISVTGLQEGGSVKYQGLTVGYVSDIYIDPEDIRRVVVEVSLDHSTPIKTDTQADIAFLGITGLKLIELRGGSQDAEALQPGKFITPGRSVTDLITGRAEVIAEKTEVILNHIADLLQEKNRDKILALVDQTKTTFDELHDLVDKNNRALTSTIANAENISTDLQEITGTAKSSMFALDDLITSDSLKIAIGNLAEITETVKRAELVRLVQEMNIALERMNGLLREVDVSFTKSRTDLMYTIESMRESIDYLNLFARTISEDPSVLVRGTKPENAPDFQLER